MMRSTARICRLKITLRGTVPPVWRRVLVPGDVTLDRIHRVLQIVMGWTDSHLHQFHVGDVRYGDPIERLTTCFSGWAEVTWAANGVQFFLYAHGIA